MTSALALDTVAIKPGSPVPRLPENLLRRSDKAQPVSARDQCRMLEWPALVDIVARLRDADSNPATREDAQLIFDAVTRSQTGHQEEGP